MQLKQSADLHTSTFNQVVAYEVARDGFIDEHVRTIRRVYKERRDVMLQTMDEFFPKEVEWTRPQGGLFLWGTHYPKAWIATACSKLLSIRTLRSCRDIVSSREEADGYRNFRLNFSASNPEQIREGIRRLSVAIKLQMEERNIHHEPAMV